MIVVNCSREPVESSAQFMCACNSLDQSKMYIDLHRTGKTSSAVWLNLRFLGLRILSEYFWLSCRCCWNSCDTTSSNIHVKCVILLEIVRHRMRQFCYLCTCLWSKNEQEAEVGSFSATHWTEQNNTIYFKTFAIDLNNHSRRNDNVSECVMENKQVAVSILSYRQRMLQ